MKSSHLLWTLDRLCADTRRRFWWFGVHVDHDHTRSYEYAPPFSKMKHQLSLSCRRRSDPRSDAVRTWIVRTRARIARDHAHLEFAVTETVLQCIFENRLWSRRWLVRPCCRFCRRTLSSQVPRRARLLTLARADRLCGCRLL